MNDALGPSLGRTVAARRARRDERPALSSAALQRWSLWGMDKPTNMPENHPEMAARVASLKDEEKVYLNLSTAYASGGREGMERVIADIDVEMTRYAPADKDAVMGVVRGQKQKLEGQRESFVKMFEDNARGTANALLDTSKKAIEDELARYGFQEAIEYKDGLPQQTGNYTMKPTHAMDELAQTAKALAAEYEKLANMGIQLKEKYRKQHERGPMEQAQVDEDASKVLLKDDAYVEAAQKYDMHYHDAMAKFPMLAALKEDPNAVAALRAGGKSPQANAMVLDHIKPKLENIAETKTNLAEGGRLNPLSLPNVVNGTKKGLAVEPGSLRNRFVDDAVGKLADDKEMREKAVMAIGITIAVVGAVATAGGSLVVAAGATGAGLGVTGAQLFERLQDFKAEKAAANTDLDKAKSISENDPDLFWLAVDIVGFVADVVAAGKLLKAAAGPIRKLTGATLAAERAGGGKIAADEAKKLATILDQEVEPALAGLPEQGRAKIRGRLDPGAKLPSVVRAGAEGAAWTQQGLESALQHSTPGKQAWARKLEHEVHLTTSPSGATYYDPHLNTIFISRTMNAEEASTAFVHEMGHAHWDNAGLTANRMIERGIGRSEYIEKMCREEAVAQSAAIRHNFESQTKLGRPFQPGTMGERAYSDAFAAKSMELRGATPPPDPLMIKNAAEKAGEEAVYREFIEGRATNNITTESYVTYYGHEWDMRAPPGTSRTGPPSMGP